MITEHQPGDTMGRLDVGRFAGEGDLDGGWAPGDEVDEMAFAYSQEGFVDLLGR
jgi:hypothetical protein